VHALLLTIRFVDPEAFNRVFQDTPLEVVLVNARTTEKPTQAQALAQANLAGGGDLAQGRASSPLPLSSETEQGDSDTSSRAKQLQKLQQQQEVLLSQVRSQVMALTSISPEILGEHAAQDATEEKRRRLDQLLAAIEQTINADNSRPKKRYVSPATKEVPYALYYDRLRRRIEDKGTQHFPEAEGKKLYGELTMTLTIQQDGTVVETKVVDGSGSYTLDRRAEAIARSAAPFGLFSEGMRPTQQIVVVSRFRFTREENLQTQVSGQ
jgi:protein TonB